MKKRKKEPNEITPQPGQAWSIKKGIVDPKEREKITQGLARAFFVRGNWGIRPAKKIELPPFTPRTIVRKKARPVDEA